LVRQIYIWGGDRDVVPATDSYFRTLVNL
jgi:hypothetical protein